MKFLDALEKRFGHLAVPNVIMVLIVAQLVITAFIMIGRIEFESLLLVPKAVLAGEWWRLFSFLIAPPHVATTAFQALFLAFFWYILWMMSNALESEWGVFRFNLYLLCGIFFTVLGAFLGQFISSQALIFVSPRFLYLSIFFAFATLNPNIEFLLFFVLPVKVKWIAWVIGGFTALAFLFAPTLGDRVAIIAPLLNYFLFFRKPLLQSVEAQKRRKQFAAEREKAAGEALHTCSLCGVTDRSDPDRDFRYRMVDGEAVCICENCKAEAEAEA